MKPHEPQIRLFALSAKLFEAAEAAADEFHRTLYELQVALRHLGKLVNPLNDRRRIHGLLQRLEDLAHELGSGPSGGGKSITVGRGYVELLSHVAGRTSADRPRRIGRCLTAPHDLAELIDELSLAALDADLAENPDVKSVLSFIEASVQPSGAGLLELSSLVEGGTTSPSARPAAAKTDPQAVESDWQAALEMLKTEARDFAAGIVPDQKTVFARQAELCRQRIQTAIAHGGVIDAMRQSHPILTDVLAEKIMRPRGGMRVDVPVIYGGGAPAIGFPLHCAEPVPDTWKAEHALHVALVSMRHVKMDINVQRSYLLNAELPGNLPMDVQDRMCFERGLALLRELKQTYRGRRVMIYLHHTGLETAVVGFYRAAIHTILESQRPVSLLRVLWERFSIKRPYLARPMRWVEKWLWPSTHPGPWLRVTPVYEQESGPANHGPVWPAAVKGGRVDA